MKGNIGNVLYPYNFMAGNWLIEFKSVIFKSFAPVDAGPQNSESYGVLIFHYGKTILSKVLRSIPACSLELDRTKSFQN